MIIHVLLIFNGISESPHTRLSAPQNNPNSQYDPSSSIHPIQFLATQAEVKFQGLLEKQSQTLEDACAEYQRRYGRPPPPHFDKWFQSAQNRQFLLTDEFDNMMSALEPFWGASPVDLRARVESLIIASQGHVARFQVKQHSFSTSDPSHYMSYPIHSWLNAEVIATLPDLVFAVNHLDEPKVVVPHDVLSQALSIARQPHPEPSLLGKNPGLARDAEILNLGQQHVWEAVSLSCPADSPARDFSEASLSPFLTDTGFLSNITLSKDTCQFPTLHNLHFALLFPASLGVTHSLVPVFSQGKTYSFNDILFPSPSYSIQRGTRDHDDDKDTEWDEKENIVYWTVSNTGGHSTTDNWRSLHHQRLALMSMDEDRPVKLLKQTQKLDNKPSKWVPINSTMATISPFTDVQITAAIQCDPDACQAQNDFFHTDGGRDEASTSYGSRYNIDMDGNGHSGRFYRLLGSKSTVFKQTLFKEWHDDWLIPWLHYFPMSMDLQDFPETVRYLTQEDEGRALGKNIAENSREWSRKVLREQDAKLLFWRLMLEYGRLLMSDDRHDLKCDNCSISYGFE